MPRPKLGPIDWLIAATIAFVVLLTLTGCLTEPELPDPAYGLGSPDAAGVRFTVWNPGSPEPGCTLVLTGRLHPEQTARVRNWHGVPALEPLMAYWAPSFEDCPPGYDPATGAP